MQGVKGQFSHAPHHLFPATGKYFLLQPWNREEALQVLSIETHSVSPEEWQSWLNIVDCGAWTYDPTTEAGFADYVGHIQQQIEAEQVEKVVPARFALRPLKEFKPIKAFESACEKYPSAFNYLVYHPAYGLWIGATPEVFLQVHGNEGQTVALAGTLRSDTEHWTDKEIEEQGVTGKFVGEVLLANHCTYTTEALTTTQAGPLRHLVTRYHFQPEAIRVNSLMADLHPTPAVGGYPRQEALQIIRSHERFDRQLYTGWLGWIEDDQLHAWVNLRCARLFEDKAVLFAGCGVNLGSEAAKEWLETEAKMDVIASCLQ